MAYCFHYKPILLIQKMTDITLFIMQCRRGDEHIVIDIKDNETIWHIKNKIENAYQYPIDKQTLLCGGSIFDNGVIVSNIGEGIETSLCLLLEDY